ncbi:MAG TPA: 50S ribosomal protein L33 [Candidatus Pacearchaeota archaeon]|nr:50S ribosomal protein L33 [Candidatus Pacearchaeota archaeon]HQI74744.1 50S ribosomal protein L33 [Candidatus Pacearchaeota archaeon]
MATKKRKAYVKMQCTKCKNLNYSTYKSKKVEGKIELKKFCRPCKAHTLHKEIKK